MADQDKILVDELRALIAEISELDPAEITLDANLGEDLGMDSMMALEILAEIEKKYRLKIPEENLTKMATLQQITDIVKQYRDVA